MTEATSSQAPKKKLLLVSSSGGHLKHLTATSAAWQDYDRVWVSFKQPDVESSPVSYTHLTLPTILLV